MRKIKTPFNRRKQLTSRIINVFGQNRAINDSADIRKYLYRPSGFARNNDILFRYGY